MAEVDSRRALAERYYELVDRNDVDGVVALFAVNAVYERPGYDPLLGRNGIDAFYRSDRVIAYGKHTLAKVVVNGDDVAVEGAFSGVLRDGTRVDVRFADFFQIRDHEFAQRRTYFFAPSV